MSDNRLLDFYEELHEDNLSFIYNGRFSDAITEKLIELSEFNINNTEEVRKLRKKVSFIMMESFQNIVRHGIKKTNFDAKTSYPSTFLVRNRGKAFYITSVNIIDNKEVNNLKEKLDKINTLSKEELKSLFNKVLTSESFSEKGGAGLGLIEMVRRTGEPIDYEFKKVEEEKSYCYMRIKLKRLDDTEVKFAPFSADKELHSHFVKADVLLLYKGDFSQKAVVPMIRMMEENMQSLVEELSKQKKTFNVLVEVLQNISKHGQPNENNKNTGVFMISKRDDTYILSAGNVIDNEKAKILNENLENLASLNAEELNLLYRKTLRAERNPGGGAGLGLIDIYRDSCSRVKYEFSKIHENQLFYSISINV